MQVMKLANHLLLSAALTALGAGRAAGQGYLDAAPAARNCNAPTMKVTARSDIECAVLSSLGGTWRSFSFINGVCILSKSSECGGSDAETVFKKRASFYSPHPGYEQQVGARLFWVFQHRRTGQVNFSRTWDDYERGFGDVSNTEFWSGLQLIHSFTQSQSSTLRIEMTTVYGVFYVAEWSSFTVAGASTNYKMNCGPLISGSSNISGDAMNGHRGQQFYTMDRDNVNSCTTQFGHGGFWFGNCHVVNPNGLYSATEQTGSSKYGHMCCQYVEGCKTLREMRMMLQM